MSKKNKHFPNARKADIALQILTIFQQNHRKSFNCKQLATRLGINNKEGNHTVETYVNILLEKNELEEVQRGKFRLKSHGGYITGVIDLTPYGTAYVASGEVKEDIFIAAANLNHALNGDTVKVYMFANRKDRRPEGEVVEILKEGRRDFVGVVERNKNYAFVVIDKKHIPYDIFVPFENLQNAKNGQKVIVRITDWSQKARNPIGTVIEVLGDAGDNETEMHAILAEFDLPYRFSAEVEKFAEQIPEEISAEEISKRRDFRDVCTYTIDPEDAKDFDDALSIKFLDNGNYQIGVHIADVTHYVRPETKIEEEARARATSVYLVDRTVPMLPEKLSNKVCSLRPNEEKLTFSAVFELTPEAHIVNEWFGRTVINSNRRFTYEEAQTIIETGTGDLQHEILTMDALAKKLRARRFEKGAIAFDRKEVKFRIDEKGKPLSVFYKESKDSNKLIEEFMLLANKRVAEFVGKLKGSPTFVYRIHDNPDETKLHDFAQFIKKFGYKLNTSGGKSTATSLNSLLTEIRGKKESELFENLAVRAMAKAVYSTTNIGHFGLAFPYYTHFTSPIRRYPDMMVHRLLDRYLQHQKSASLEEYEDNCRHSSGREQLAANAERASIKYKQVEFMKDHIGKEFAGIISGITERGFFVELSDNLCEGLVSIRDLTDDQYIFDDKNYCLRGKFTHRTFTFGDEVRIKIVRADLLKRQLDFVLAEEESPLNPLQGNLLKQ
ncbi:MAG: ribonuclease R [Bacteroidales bacterium]|jgi:ribonuclease R|nr:ribonuclease R [Bacteroidales bacterium]